MELVEELKSKYAMALDDYLSGGGETALSDAYELGRKSLEQGDLIFAIARFQSDHLNNILNKPLSENEKEKIISAANAFFIEFLSPFVMTFKGFWDVVQNLQTEINVRKQAEENYVKSVNYYEGLIRNALDIITILDKEAKMIYYSASVGRILGYSATELIGENAFLYIHPEDVDRVLELFTKTVTIPGFTARTEYRFRHKNGDWVILESVGKNMLNDPDIRGVIVNSRDITDRRNLEDMRRKYEFIANASNELMALIDKQYRFEAVNEAYCITLSRKRSDILGKTVEEIFGNEIFNSEIKDHINRCFSGGGTLSGAWLNLPSLGQKYMEFAFYPYSNPQSQITHVVFVARDVTERKRKEDEIKESQMQLAEAQRIANMGSWEWKISSDRVWCSEELCNILGLNPSHQEISLTEFLNFIHPGDKQSMRQIFKDALSSGTPFTRENEIIRQNNERRIIQIRGKIVYNEINLTSKIIGTIQDITNQELAQQAIRASEIKYRRLFETSKEGILLVDASTGIISDINPFIIDFLGFPKETYIHSKLWEIRPAVGIRDTEKAFKDILEEEYARYDELELNTHEGKKVKIEFVSIAYSENTNRLIQCHILDITERKLLQEELNKAAKKRADDLKRFAYSIQSAQEDERLRIARELHDEVCQRLTAIKFKLDIFEDEAKAGNRMNVNKLKSAKNDVDNLIKEVRGISSNLRPTALDHFGMVTALRMLCSESKKLHKVKINFDSDIPTFNHYDPNIEIAIYRIGQEALSNSIKHSGAKEIKVNISENDGKLLFILADNGKGFDMEKFNDISKTENGHYGLINMRERSEQFGGKFRINSQKGKGTKVEVSIPVAKKEAE